MTVVKMLVEGGAQLLKPKADGMTILHVAASSNDIHMLDYALNLIKDYENVPPGYVDL